MWRGNQGESRRLTSHCRFGRFAPSPAGLEHRLDRESMGRRDMPRLRLGTSAMLETLSAMFRGVGGRRGIGVIT